MSKYEYWFKDKARAAPRLFAFEERKFNDINVRFNKEDVNE
jgi:hypothetical protein